MMYIYRDKNTEEPDDQIRKQALLEALCGTKIWTEIYLHDNPFIYITPRKQDISGEKGRLILNKFKNIFYESYTMYHDIL